MGGYKARNHGDGPQSRFLAIGTFGHRQNQAADDHASHNIVLENIRKALEEECKHIVEAEEALSQEKSLTKKEQELQKLMIRMSLDDYLHMSTADATHYCSFQERSSWTETMKLARSEEKERYLCISDGFMICCLDLKSKADDGSGQTLPTTATLDLLEMGLPASMGLFKLGSGAYMMSGQEFPNYEDLLDSPGDFLEYLYAKYGFAGTSRKTYHLSRGDGRLDLFECDNIPLMKKAKFWPIVERMGDEIHVIESIPDSFLYPPHNPPSHEVLDLKEVGRGWMELPPLRDPEDETRGLMIVNHMVIGDRIYALVEGLRECFVFDSKSKKWEGHGDQQRTKHVGSLLYHGKGICCGQLLTRGSPPDHPLYVIIGIGDSIEAAAHLVDKKGEIVWTWELPNLFEGLKSSGNHIMMETSLFKVEEEQGTTTICAVVLGNDRVTAADFLCVSTFSVEQEAVTKPPSPNSVLLPHALYKSDNDTDTDDDAQVKPPECCLLPKVVVKESHVYQLPCPILGADSAPYYPPRLSACFL